MDTKLPRLDKQAIEFQAKMRSRNYITRYLQSLRNIAVLFTMSEL